MLVLHLDELPPKGNPPLRSVTPVKQHGKVLRK
jgi:hypothetical protein